MSREITDKLSRGKRLPTTEEALYGTGAIVAQFSSAMAYGPRPKPCFGRDDAPRVILFPWGHRPADFPRKFK